MEAVLSDDLTGAMDAGLQAWRRGLRVLVAAFAGRFSVELSNTGLENADLLIIDTESRNQNPVEAARRVHSAAEFLAASGFPLVYKKVDSMIRGNLGAEIEAALEIGAQTGCLLAPALPETGRWTRRGVHFVGESPVSEGAAGRDPFSPVRTSFIPELLATQTGLKSVSIATEVLSRGPAGLAAELSLAAADGAKIAVVDAETRDDLACIAAALEPPELNWLPAGSAGLFAHLGLSAEGGRAISSTHSRPSAETDPILPARTDSGVLIVSGSLSEVTRRQIDLSLGQVSSLTLLRPDRDAVTGSDETFRRETQRITEAVVGRLAQSEHVVLDIAATDAGRAAQSARSDAAAFQVESDTLRRFLGTVLERVCRVLTPAGLVLTGGDVAATVCAALSAEAIQIVGEVEPVVPIGRLVGGIADGIPVVTKAGAFGGPRIIASAINRIAACYGA